MTEEELQKWNLLTHEEKWKYEDNWHSGLQTLIWSGATEERIREYETRNPIPPAPPLPR